MTPRILYEDRDLVVVEKPPGIFTHPSPGHETGTLADALWRIYPEMRTVGSDTRGGVVHRLDADTSGVMVFARTQRAYLDLRRQFERHESIGKVYLAVTHGAPQTRMGTVKTLIGRKAWDPKRMAVFATDDPAAPEDAKHAVTSWVTISRQGRLALVEFTIRTGRTHQIRVHAAHLGCPIAGDPLYGDPARDRRMAHPPGRTLLHAVTLAFGHPVTGKRLTFSSEPPPDIVYAH